MFMPYQMFPFQVALTEWAVRKGRAAVFADCGLGKTLIQLAWAENVVRHTNRPVLILTPLAVARQTIREAAKFGIDAAAPLREGAAPARIVVANYERLHQHDPTNYAAVVCDESSILKSFNGVRRGEITHFMRKVQYRLLCTATAAPNDYIELGTSSEALGELGHMDMLERFFKNDQNTPLANRKFGNVAKWRFKGHAETPFWRWVCSWAMALRKPSDLGFDDSGFALPSLVERDHIVDATSPPDGMLFTMPAVSMREEREERRRTLRERCEMVAELVNHQAPAVVWCHMNDEGALLEKLILGSRQVSGNDSESEKEAAYEAFADGSLRVIITKPKIGAWGLNWQHCAHVVSFASHSYEQSYQAVRRCWRFGQKSPVTVDTVYTEGESRIKNNLKRKAVQAERMFASLVEHMNNAAKLNRSRITKPTEAPEWLSPINS